MQYSVQSWLKRLTYIKIWEIVKDPEGFYCYQESFLKKFFKQFFKHVLLCTFVSSCIENLTLKYMKVRKLHSSPLDNILIYNLVNSVKSNSYNIFFCYCAAFFLGFQVIMHLWRLSKLLHLTTTGETKNNTVIYSHDTLVFFKLFVPLGSNYSIWSCNDIVLCLESDLIVCSLHKELIIWEDVLWSNILPAIFFSLCIVVYFNKLLAKIYKLVNSVPIFRRQSSPSFLMKGRD